MRRVRFAAWPCRWAAALVAVLISACETPPVAPGPRAPVAPAPTIGAHTRQIEVNGVRLTYSEQGNGVPVVLVHGSLSDLRIWEAQRLAIAQRYRYVALTQRYFGTDRWSGSGRDFTQAAHAADLAVFIRSLNGGPVHLVGWSYGGLTALLMAKEHPELVRTLTLHEPGVRSLILDTAEGRQASAEFSRTLVPAAAAARAGDALQAARLFHEAMFSLPPGGFESEPPALQHIVLDNARTMILALQAPPPPPLTCESLKAIRSPALVTMGENARAQYRMIAEKTAACLGNATLAIIPAANHDAPIRNPGVFNATLLSFLHRN
jgi:pimeloyl-ACP methyl ester carboxylesterase